MSRFSKGQKLSDVVRHQSKPGKVQGNEEAVRKIVEEAHNSISAGDEGTKNVIAMLESVPTAVAVQAIRTIGEDLREESLPLLERFANSEDATLGLAAIEALSATRSEKAVPLLANVVDRGTSKELEKAARRSIFRLKSMGIAIANVPAAKEPASPLARQPGMLVEACMSNPDGTGHQLLEAITEAPFGGVDVVMLLVSDTVGIEQFNFTDTTRKAWLRRLEQIKKEYQGVTVVEIPVAYFRNKVRQAYELSQASGKAVTSRFGRWRDVLCETEDGHSEHPLYHEISIVEIKWNPDLLEQSPQILRNIELAGWLWPSEELSSYLDELRAVKEGRITLPGWVEAEKSTDIIKRALDHFLDPPGRARYKRRLEDVAYVFLHTDRLLDAKRALAAANGFDEQTGVANERHPFAMALFAESVEQLLEGKGEKESSKLITDLSEIAPYITSE